MSTRAHTRIITNNNMYFKFSNSILLATIVYVDDIIFGRNEESLSQNFSVSKEFEMSLIGELTFFIGLQISHDSTSIFTSQSKYLKDMLQKFGTKRAPLYVRPW